MKKKCSICRKSVAQYFLEENKKTQYFCRKCASAYLLSHHYISFLPRIKD